VVDGGGSIGGGGGAGGYRTSFPGGTKISLDVELLSNYSWRRWYLYLLTNGSAFNIFINYIYRWRRRRIVTFS
jgi:hypothetical protein